MEVLHVVLYGRGHGQNMRQDPEEAMPPFRHKEFSGLRTISRPRHIIMKCSLSTMCEGTSPKCMST